jgi:hypothetical protein
MADATEYGIETVVEMEIHRADGTVERVRVDAAHPDDQHSGGSDGSS